MNIKPIFLALAISFLQSCAKEFRPRDDIWDAVSANQQRSRIVQDAKDLSHHRYFHANKQYIPKDCSGYVATILYRNGFDVYGGASARNIEGNGVSLIHEFILRDGEVFKDQPEPGDLVFFSNTYDKNEDGKINDPLTHIGIVTSVRDDQTVTFLHYLQGKVKTGILNLTEPHSIEMGGSKINSYLRRKSRRDPAQTPYLSGELFQAFGAFIKRPDDLSDLTE